MKEIFNTVRTAAAALGGLIGLFIGGRDGLIAALAVFVVIDTATGLMSAASEGRLSSEVGFRGILRKMLIFIIVGMGHIIDTLIIGGGSVLRTAFIFFYIANEGLSIAENSVKLGLPLPRRLRLALMQLHDDAEGGKEEDDINGKN
ncbi:MAG: phage holin family protein [Clostridiales bacterium]|jgi:toxin secretion/phage lysis holin|nr:phage holin family protein [Clostridiales bacterium]